ncbi:OTU domain-containing protein 4 [Chiloscyllium punctatum]|uniref:OTU domain-containing protein 4 n=1 Tax=Chiloscyllium punctatum TaxID=137246 RepID=A0A401SRD5_CHIPU|nr:hypothetical protein [Chiloscyllium punctatum]
MERGGAAGNGKSHQAVERCNSSAHPNELLLDEYLRSQGLCRKRIAKDGSCLFRAVSEQVFHTQSKHLEVRRACVSYLRRNRDKFEAFIEGSFDEYLKHLEKPQEWVGQVEISALSLLYKRDFIIYQEPNRPPARVTENGFPDTILLCFSNGNHYDSVYPKTFVDAAAICQSILYEMLYQNVFKVDIRAIMPSVLDANSEINEEHFNDSENSDSDVEVEMIGGKTANERDVTGFKSQSCNKVLKKQQMKSESSTHVTLPRKVLQAFNPNIYRNIEYEVWQKMEQAQQKKDYSIAAGMQYAVGDKCKVFLDDGRYYNAHIQAVDPDDGPVVVYVEELGEKYNASLQNLRPLTQVSRGSSWNRVQGKRAKKPMNINSEADFKGVKNSSSFVNKPNRLQSSLPPRLQQTMGARQQCSTQQSPGQQPKKSSAEYVGRDEDFPKLSKKHDRDLESNYTNSECQHLAPSVKVEPEANEAQAPDKMHQRAEQPFPALNNPLEIPPCPTTQRMDPVLQSDMSSSHLPSSTPSLTSPVLSVHPSESVTCQSAVMSSPTVSQPQVTSAFITPLCAPMRGANLPPMPATHITSSYDDLLYPGFAVNEKGEYLTSAPVFSYNKNGADLPNDKSILRFFYNLGVKAYSLPLWPPYSYLYPLNQAYLKSCGIYPRSPAPIFHPNPWFHATAGVMQNENVMSPPHLSSPAETNAPDHSVQRDISDIHSHSPLPQAATLLLPHKSKPVLDTPIPEQSPQNLNPSFPRYFPNLIADGTQHSGWRPPVPQALFSQQAQMHAFSFHPMYMALPSHVFPLQVNNDQKVGAPDLGEPVSDNTQRREMEEMGRQPKLLTSAEDDRLTRSQPVIFEGSRLLVKAGGGIGDAYPLVEEQSVSSPGEGRAKQHSALKRDKESVLIEKLNPAPDSGFSGVDTQSFEAHKVAGADANELEVASQHPEAKSRSDLTLQCISESNVDPVAHDAEVTLLDHTSENNYKMPAMLNNNKPVQFYSQTLGKERHYVKEDSSSERTVYRRSPYVRKKGEKEMSRKKWQGKSWASKTTCCLPDSHVNNRDAADSIKNESKSPTKAGSVQGVNSVAQNSEIHIDLGTDRHESKNENKQEKVKNQKFSMRQNRLDEETGLGIRRNHDVKEFQNRMDVENVSGMSFEGKHSSFKKQRYRAGGKPNPAVRKY